MNELLEHAVPVLAALAVAGLGAVTSWYERRDARLRAHRQLELARSRTSFVASWLTAYRSLPVDDDGLRDVFGRARAELEDAYGEACVALSDERRAIEQGAPDQRATSIPPVWWRTALLLAPRRRLSTTVIAWAFYIVVALSAVTVVGALVDPTTADGRPLNRGALIVGFSVVVGLAWLVCFGLITLAARGGRGDRARGSAWAAPDPAARSAAPSRR
ncbi:MAG: hypothetical protein ACK5OX_19835 [Desertimonas sp.]